MEEAVNRITQLMHALISVDNEQRTQAEAALKQLYIDAHPDLGLSGIIHILRHNSDVPVRLT
jgi:hypothetical protein